MPIVLSHFGHHRNIHFLDTFHTMEHISFWKGFQRKLLLVTNQKLKKVSKKNQCRDTAILVFQTHEIKGLFGNSFQTTVFIV